MLAVKSAAERIRIPHQTEKTFVIYSYIISLAFIWSGEIGKQNHIYDILVGRERYVIHSMLRRQYFTVTKARFTQVKFFNGYPSNYIFQISF